MRAPKILQEFIAHANIVTKTFHHLKIKTDTKKTVKKSLNRKIMLYYK